MSIGSRPTLCALLLLLPCALSACSRGGFAEQPPDARVDAPAIEDLARDATPADQSIDAPADQFIIRDLWIDSDLPPAPDVLPMDAGLISDLDWERCRDEANWTCTSDPADSCAATCDGVFSTWCTGVVCGCGGLGQPLSYGLNSGTDCATCLAAGVGCVVYYANL